MSLTVKAYFERGDGNTEIRRFAIDQDVSTSFVYLSKKVHQVFPGLELTKVVLYWKDSEGDLIAFSSDEELIVALSEVQDGVFKIIIKGADQAESSSAGKEHPGVLCDECEKRVVGIRYKCLTCPDYDLCMSCEKKTKHSEHPMMRMCEPRPPHAPFIPGGPWSHSVPPGGPGTQGPGWGAPFQAGHCPPWMMRKCIRRWMQQQNEQRAASEGANGAENSGEAGNGNPSDWSFLKNMGDHVAAMLDPLGIDVEIDVEHKGQRQRCSKKPAGKAGGGKCKRQQKANKKDEKAEDKKDATQDEKAEDKKDVTQDEGAQKAEDKKDVTQDEGAQKAEDKKDVTQDEGADKMGTSENVVADSTTPEVTKNAASPPVPLTKLLPSQPAEKVAESDWTFVSPSGSPSAPQMEGEDQVPGQTSMEAKLSQTSPSGALPANSGAIYPELPVEPQPMHPDPKVNKSLEQMMAMGFSNEGKWLERLLEAKKGDISQVLDAIQPARRN